jgi:hypothetical protein
MLLLKKTDNPATLFALGQISLVLGILGILIGSSGDWTGLPNFVLGVISGLAAVLLGISMVLNITGIKMRKKGN